MSMQSRLIYNGGDKYLNKLMFFLVDVHKSLRQISQCNICRIGYSAHNTLNCFRQDTLSVAHAVLGAWQTIRPFQR